MLHAKRQANNQSDNTLDVTNPFDGSLIETLTRHSHDEVMAMLETAHALYQNRDGWLPAHQRIAVMNKLAGLLEAELDDAAMLIAREGGKPLRDAKAEAARALDGIHIAIREIANMRGSQIPMDLTEAGAGRTAYTQHEPIGVVVALSAFNHPLNLAVHQVLPAIAAGCPVIIKPASDTPLSAKRLVELVREAGLPEGWCQFCICDSSTAEALATDARVGFLSFIGSAQIGWMLRNKLAPGTRCALEHGGIAPVIVDETVDLDSILDPLAKGGFYHAGQVCVSVQRIYTPKAQAELLAKKLAEKANTLKVDNAIKEDTDVGPLIRPKEVNRVAEWVSQAIRDGATLVTGGKKLSDSTYSPTVLLNPPEDAKVTREEVFGPVVCVYGYETLDEAIERANSDSFAFQSAIFSNDINAALYATHRLDAATVIVNDHTAFRVDWMPFAGHKQSGHSTGGIGYTMHDMLSEKLVVIRQA